MKFLATTLPLKDNDKILLQAFVLVLFVFVLYHRAVSGTILSIDDAGIMKFYSSPGLTLRGVLSPGQGYYYRPVIALSFFLDFHLLGQDPVLMHLENIVIHAANALLVFVLAARMLGRGGLAPLAAALLFAAHPANCEAVSWIAGRTDALAAFFVLCAALFLIKALEEGRVRHAILSVSCVALGVMTKETAVVFVPATFVLVACWPRLRPGASRAIVKRQGTLLALLYLALFCVVAALFVTRMGGAHNSITKLVTGHKLAPLSSLLLCLKVFGFYLKKLVAPWPLNFAVTEISDWYAFVGAAGLLLLFFAARRTPAFLLVAIGLAFLLPPIAVALFDIAWTVAAERYLYIPSAFLFIGCAGYLHGIAWGGARRILIAAATLCLMAAAVTTVRRTAVWGSNLAMFQDAVATNPGSGLLHNELALALIRAGRIAEAEKELAKASSMEVNDGTRRLIQRNKLVLGIKDASAGAIRRTVNASQVPKPQQDTEVLEVLRQSDYALLRDAGEKSEREALVAEILEVSAILYSRSGNPLYPYNDGQLHLSRGDRARALACFTRCLRTAPEGSLYKAPAAKLVATLSSEL